MGKRFRSCDLNQAYLLPPSLQDWLPEGHLARFVAEVVEALDLSVMYAKYEAGDGRGLAAYDPPMMVRVLIYGYCRGVAATQEANDKQQLVPMLKEVKVQMGIPPRQATADNGYFSEANVTDAQLQEIDLLVAPDRQKHGEKRPTTTGPPPPDAGVAEQMRHKLRTAEGQAVYKLRKAVVEPVFGQIKEARGFRRFLLRGLGKVQAEWQMICATHNLLKLFRFGWSPQGA